MLIDPDAVNLLAMLKAAGRPPLTSLTPPEAREGYRAGRAVLQPPLPDVAELRDLEVAGPHGPVPVRFYRGSGAAPAATPALLFIHGGGWVIGDCDTHDYVCRKLANDCGCCVFSVDYRLGPEHRFPAAVDDCLAVARWLAKEAAQFGVDASKLAVGGDSAGGNLSAVLALMARDGDAPAFVYQLLLYPAVDMNMNAPSFARIPEDYPLSPSVSRWFRDNYLERESERQDWRASPLLAKSHAGVAPAFVLTARHDPLCDEGAAYAQKLEDAGVRVWRLDMNDQLHGFLTWGKVVRAADAALDMACAALRYAFATMKG
ncbi:MAG: alpha/beta hydrolase [Hyphomicrobiales bacterium]|nr:alpha/beta hydrolase [Hyphomicrobiales bacterium]